MKALVDGDVIRYAVGFASQKNIHRVFIKGEEEHGYAASFEKKKELNAWLEEQGLSNDDVVLDTIIEAEPVENCLHSVKLFISSILDRAEADEYTIYLTGTGNFREEVATILPYKGNRDSSHKPVHYDAITDYLLANWKTEVIDGMEADDAMSIEQYWDYANDDLTIICSIDKDLDNTPGRHFNWNKDSVYWVSEEEATYNFYKQLLTGDATDNILGCAVKETLVYKSGEKKGIEYQKRIGVSAAEADKILGGLPSELLLYEAVCDEYRKRLKDSGADWKLVMKENAYLLWMVRELDEDGKPVMWKPPV